MMIEQHAKETCGFDRDILEWNIPEEVLAVLLKDRSTGRNLIWATEDYAERGKGFDAGDETRHVYLAFPNCHTLNLQRSCLESDE